MALDQRTGMPISPATNLPQYNNPESYMGGSPPSPKGDISPLPTPAQAIPTMDPSWNRFTAPAPIASPTGAQKPWGANDNPQADYLQQAIDIYDSMDYGSDTGQREVQVSVSGQEAPTSSWRDQIYADRAANQSGGSSGGSYAAGPGGAPREPYEALKSPDMPEFQGDKYAPPERDGAIYDEERRKAMGPGMRALREGTREAISSSQSLDNPNARGKFIQQALQGYGQGLEDVSAGAHREATGIADRRNAEATSLYKTKYEYKRSNDLMNYQAEVNQIAADFASESAASMMNYNAGLGQNNQPGGTSGGTANARSKSTYYNDSTPNMGYFA